jgi:hypothetical protein
MDIGDNHLWWLGRNVGMEGLIMNQSAFPWMVDDGKTVTGNKGMTLRDYFAAEAMKPLTQSFLDKDMDMLDPNGWMDGLAMDAYSMADAMMKAREA